MRSRKYLPAAALGMGAALLLAGCSTNGGGATGGGDQNTLTVFWKGSEQAGIDAVVEAFEAQHDDVQVKLDVADVEQYQATIRTQLSAGTAPDVLFVWPANGNPAALQQIAPGGFLEDLSSSEWASEYNDLLKSLTSVDGKTYLMAPAVTAFGPWYNQTAMDEAGLEAPSVWSDVIPFCEAASAEGKTAFALGAGTPNATQNVLYGLVPDLVYGVDADFDAQLESGDATFSGNEGWNTAMERYQEMGEAGCFSPDATGTTSDEQIRQVAAGEAMGMFGIGFQVGGLREQAPDAEFSLHVLSGDDDASSDLVTISNAGGAAVNAEAKNKELAVEFVDFLGSAEGLQTYNDALGGTVPSIPTGEAEDDQNLETITQYLSDGKSVQFLNQFWPNARIEQAMYAGIQGMLAGSETPADVLKAMDAEYPSN